MKALFYSILFFFLLQPTLMLGAELERITRVKNGDIEQLYFSFDQTPTFDSRQDKRRIDLIFNATAPSPELKLFDTDEHLVKILSNQVQEKLIFSLYFRYRPQKYKITRSVDGKIVFEVLLGNQYSGSYEDLTDRLKGLRLVERSGPDFTNPSLITPYNQDWMSFFSQYESDISINIPVTFSSPPFPIIRLLAPGHEKNLTVLNEEVFKYADQKAWPQVAITVRALIDETKDIEKLKLLALTYGEAFLRSGDFENSYKQLYLIKQNYQEEILATYASYLLVHLQTTFVDPYLGEYEYSLLEDFIPDTSPLAPYFLLSRIDTALAAGKYKRMNQLLQQDTIGLPAEIEEKIRIREADYWYAIKQPIKAYAAYKLRENSTILPTLPFSYGGYCSTLYDQKKFNGAAACYKGLTGILDEKSIQALSGYREKMARLKFENPRSLISAFSSIEETYPNTEAAHRAGLKKTDLLFLQERTRAREAQKIYKILANRTSDRSIREEALFKVALIHSLLGENDAAITGIQQLLRDFRSGNLGTTALALLIDILPSEIRRLVDNGDYMQALVLAKQNKTLFQKNWLSSDFLIDIAEAYSRLGIYDEAQTLYLYLIEISPIDKREEYYLPMIQATFDYGNFILVEDYAAQYTYNYPDGKFQDQILFLRLQALVADERLDEAVELIPESFPDNDELRRFVATLYFRKDNCAGTLVQFTAVDEKGISLDPNEKIMYAECLYGNSDYDKAESIFKQIEEDNTFYDQSLFRLAQLARERGREEQALELFTRIVEDGKNTRWKKFAERELQYTRLKDRI